MRWERLHGYSGGAMTTRRATRRQIPLLQHPLTEPSAFTAEALVAAVRSERRLPVQAVPRLCFLEFDGDLTDWMVTTGYARACESWACFHTVMHTIEVDGITCGIIARTIGGPHAVLVAEQLKQQQQHEAFQRSTGRSSTTLAKYPDLRIVLVSMKANTKMHEHKAAGRLSLLTLTGYVRLKVLEHTVDVPAGHLFTLDCCVPHDVEALKQSVFLLTISWPHTVPEN